MFLKIGCTQLESFTIPTRLNSMSTPPPSSLNTIFDEFSKEPSTFIPSREGDEQPIEPISDNGINRIKKSHVY
uniref:Uncharacterized protein n=1 Tax=Populus trichocarpa TaxID=3694 RepID=A0A3N7G141_POPTR